eukprot:5732328-Amphidinium_carterae.1
MLPERTQVQLNQQEGELLRHSRSTSRQGGWSLDASNLSSLAPIASPSERHNFPLGPFFQAPGVPDHQNLQDQTHSEVHLLQTRNHVVNIPPEFYIVPQSLWLGKHARNPQHAHNQVACR